MQAISTQHKRVVKSISELTPDNSIAPPFQLKRNPVFSSEGNPTAQALEDSFTEVTKRSRRENKQLTKEKM